ncbi:MAG: YabP/YqfC family sporulation protein [Flavonifractor plautii]
MGYDEGRLTPEAAHHILLEGREQLTVSGVEEVESFDENTIVMVTAKGTLVVRGEDMHIEKLSLDGGDLKVEGAVDALSYEDDRGGRGGLSPACSADDGGHRRPAGGCSRRRSWAWPPDCNDLFRARPLRLPCWARRWTCCSGWC